MNLYLVSQSVNSDWDTYDAVVVCAVDADDAKTIHPYEDERVVPLGNGQRDKPYGAWTCQDNLQVKLIGAAAKHVKRGVVLASFNAG